MVRNNEGEWIEVDNIIINTIEKIKTCGAKCPYCNWFSDDRECVYPGVFDEGTIFSSQTLYKGLGCDRFE